MRKRGSASRAKIGEVKGERERERAATGRAKVCAIYLEGAT